LKPITSISSLALLGLAGAGLIGVGAQDHGSHNPGDPVAAGKLFQQACAGCHTAPDARFATDRAWLDQVNRTA
jgi:mono/diheme cytochrome c family protein